MIKKKKFLLFCILSFLLPMNIKALCDNTEVARLKDLASNINISYDYKIIDNKAYFDITFNNVFGELSLQDPDGNRYYYNDYNQGNFTFINYIQGANYKFDVYSNSGECSNRYLTTLYASTPTYNPYYQLSVCDDAKEYGLCQRWSKHSLNRIEFVNAVEKYKLERDKNKITNDDNDVSLLSQILSFVQMYAIYIVIGIAIIIIIIKIIKYKKDSFGF